MLRDSVCRDREVSVRAERPDRGGDRAGAGQSLARAILDLHRAFRIQPRLRSRREAREAKTRRQLVGEPVVPAVQRPDAQRFPGQQAPAPRAARGREGALASIGGALGRTGQAAVRGREREQRFAGFVEREAGIDELPLFDLGAQRKAYPSGQQAQDQQRDRQLDQRETRARWGRAPGFTSSCQAVSESRTPVLPRVS